MRVHNEAQFFKGDIQRFKIGVENDDPSGYIYIKVFNTLGQQLISRKLINKQKNEIPVNAGTGIYIVRVICDDNVFSAKVYLGD